MTTTEGYHRTEYFKAWQYKNNGMEGKSWKKKKKRWHRNTLSYIEINHDITYNIDELKEVEDQVHQVMNKSNQLKIKMLTIRD